MSLNTDKYQVLASFLEEFRSDATNTQLNANQLRQRLASLKQLFVQQIVPLTEEDSKEQSYRTEMSKQLRLLEIDIMFFQGARQVSTAQARLQTISDRLTTLIRYCDAILRPEETREES
ncbi:heterocyst frequency control protein PatD [Calothrix sp. FACHB-1219]|uniref:heterocyst frequency control protein PatD n=1 Tax=unclassified Calothrix TaxID=2619626 RepID=UPI0016862D4F|nr:MULTISPECIES: heterocyst frequency control protein PatD [unclassified Calothrix]MBD2207039.1 heterocyst frequency control protein PatD [Calothrix sp. FACHB-168]MBD2221655.1 heterocyst frequency control protein PatD [Calothrix sp. FACHB-1219]